MKAGNANLLNSIVLIGMGLWGYFDTNQAPTALIPVGFGVVLLLLSRGVARENKVIAHIAVVLTLLVLIAIIAKPLMSALADGGILKIFRVSAMVLTGILAMVAFIRSFIAARKAREAA